MWTIYDTTEIVVEDNGTKFNCSPVHKKEMSENTNFLAKRDFSLPNINVVDRSFITRENPQQR